MSIGTLVNGLTEIFRVTIEVAPARSGLQLVLSIGNNIRLDELGLIPADAIVVQELLKLSC
ncbi:hypothetical protein D1Y84_04645 [Acidipila sp. EB88]|nr:hypothetical protein D1Y84_04645 [Acidipila sp. EB88]